MQRLLEQLRSDRIEDRDEATRKLIDLGTEALPALLRAKESAGTPEIRDRLVHVIAEIRKDSLRVTLTCDPERRTLPTKSDDWFEVEFRCVLENCGDQEIVVVRPAAYKIFPHPWTVRVNGSAARLWSGSLTCAPNFTSKDLVSMKPGEKREVRFSWHRFVENFSARPGTYRFAVRYSFSPMGVMTFGDSAQSASELESRWSPEAKIELARE